MIAISQIIEPCSEALAWLPLFSSAISAGFPSPADEHLEAHLDLNRYLSPHPPTIPSMASYPRE